MIWNIVEVEHAAMLAALEESDSVSILFGFRAAFPSLAREFLFVSLEAFGFPPLATNVVKALYLHTTAHLRLHSQLHGDVSLERGIRQECPLSPLLFAITASYTVAARHPTALVMYGLRW